MNAKGFSIQTIFQEQPISVYGCGVYRQDFQSLKQFQWLRSEAITLLSAILRQQHRNLFENEESYLLQNKVNIEYTPFRLKPCKILDPFVSSMIIFMGSQTYILESMESQNLFQYRYLLIPANTQTKQGGNGSHWFLMIYDTVQNLMMTMDSAYECVHSNAILMGQRLNVMKKIFKIEEKLEQKISKIKNIEKYQKYPIVKKQLRTMWIKNVVRQQNSYDCGIFTVGNIQRILKQLTTKQQKNSENLISKQSYLFSIQQQINQYKINIPQIQVDHEFFRQLRIRYFIKAHSLLKAASQQKKKE